MKKHKRFSESTTIVAGPNLVESLYRQSCVYGRIGRFGDFLKARTIDDNFHDGVDAIWNERLCSQLNFESRAVFCVSACDLKFVTTPSFARAGCNSTWKSGYDARRKIGSHCGTLSSIDGSFFGRSQKPKISAHDSVRVAESAS